MAPHNPDQLLVRRFLAAPQGPLTVDTNPVAIDLGMELRSWDPVERCFMAAFRTREHHVQGNGAVQGGIVGTMLDFALTFPVLGCIEPPKVAVTTTLNLHFERAVMPGELQAVARINRLGGRMAFASAELMLPGGQVLARAVATMMLV